MKPPTDKGVSQEFYEDVVKELEDVAALLRKHPELNHKAVERLLAIASEIRKDAGLPKAKPAPKNRKK